MLDHALNQVADVQPIERLATAISLYLAGSVGSPFLKMTASNEVLHN